MQYTLTAGQESSFTVLAVDMADSEPINVKPTRLYSRSFDGCGSIGDRIGNVGLNVDSGRFGNPNLKGEGSIGKRAQPFDPFSVTKDATFTLMIYASA